MKPTKEQLADPRWWDENADGFDFLFYLESADRYAAANEDGTRFGILMLDLSPAKWTLLAKRPESNWVPEVGDECEFKHPQFGWTGCTIIGPFRGAIVCAPNGGGLYQGMPSDYRPVKTQREELTGIVKLNLDMGISPSGITEAILARFDLTEKDGE